MSFFFRRTPSENCGVPAFCCGVPAQGSITGDVIAPRELGSGESWVDTGLKTLVSWDVADETGKPIIVNSVGTEKILASSADSFTSYKDTVLECGGDAEADKIYVCALLPAQIINGGSSENCYIVTGESVTLSIDAECC